MHLQGGHRDAASYLPFSRSSVHDVTGCVFPLWLCIWPRMFELIPEQAACHCEYAKKLVQARGMGRLSRCLAGRLTLDLAPRPGANTDTLKPRRWHLGNQRDRFGFDLFGNRWATYRCRLRHLWSKGTPGGIAETLVRTGAPGWDRTSNPCLRRSKTESSPL